MPLNGGRSLPGSCICASGGRQGIDEAKRAKSFGVILGTLGRQGNPHVVAHITSLLREKGKQYFVLLLSEIFPAKVKCPPSGR